MPNTTVHTSKNLPSRQSVLTTQGNVLENQTSEIDWWQESDQQIKGRNLPFNGKEESKTSTEEAHNDKPPVLAIVLTSLSVIMVAIVVVIIWIYGRKRKE